MKQSLVIGSIGDISFNGKNQDAPSSDVFHNIKAILRETDVIIANLENPLIEKGGNPVQGKCTLRGATGWAAVLKKSGLNLLTLANNHMLDYGIEGLVSTIKALNEAGLPFFGAGMNMQEASSPLYLDIKGVRLALLARTSVVVSSPCYATETRPGVALFDLNELKETIGRCKNEADLVILSIHWGIEHYLYPSPRQREIARNLIEYGADLILGHHPHVLQGVEKKGKGMVSYSMGNFIFDDIKWACIDEKGESCERLVRLSKDNRKTGILKILISEKKEIDYNFIPAVISTEGLVVPNDNEHRIKEFNRLCSWLQLPFYSFFWKLYSLKQEWLLRIMPMIRGKFTWEKIRKVRLKHFNELYVRIRRSAKISSEKTTNPYE